ncbi:Alpha-actinin-like protein 1 [Psilocybe cubensis]|uniref:Alpha-actinin-like protein 1 n=1 Tax=Psilocybe cubensis TaxID=181762 RepID=A0ACB8GZH4_PSICU|nr:Alpha-actinin-like protein 1 [Psilocybe cubensis]KAH9480827.1 Alpha-actinin-like protein 1 [Psilocybe cubensis]
MITPEAEARSRDMQERTFCKWLNTKLEAHGYPTMSSLVKDLSDGVRLIQLMVRPSDTSLGRYNKNPRMRVQKAENVNKALEFIRQRNVKLTNIGPEDIIDGNLKLILGMIWTLILRFTIADIRCALIHCHRPDLLDYPSLDKQLLEVEDLCDSAHPDERSVMTYIASFFHAFSTMDQAETVSRRVEKFAELMQSVWLIRNDYERRVRLLLSSLSDIQAQWALTPTSSCTSYPAAKALSASFTQYKSTTKRTWVAERQDLATLFGNVQTKLKTYGLREYVPPAGLTLADVDEAWEKLGRVEGERWRGVNAKIREIKEDLRKRFASLAHAFERSLQDVSSSLASLSGPLESQQAQVQHIQTHRLPQLSASLKELAEAEAACEAANVEENDYTVFTCQDLEFELELVVHGVAKKIGFIDNQIVSRNMTNLTPAQLEEFESTFRYFDKDETNTLNLAEMIAALASLGIVYSEEDMDLIYEQLVSEYGNVTFEAFINLLVEITEDQTSPDQLREAFRGIAKDKPFVTELDLRLAHLPAASIEYLREAMPKAPGPESNNNGSSSGGAGGEAEYDYDRFIDEVFGSTT